MNVSFLQELLNSIAEQSRMLLPKGLFKEDPDRGMQSLVQALVSERGEASGVVIGRQILHHYNLLGENERRAFFRYLAATLKPASEGVMHAARVYLDDPSQAALSQLQKAVESPLQEFFRRLNLAPGATASIVAMRSDLLRLLRDDPELTVVDEELRRLLTSWFNRGFLVLRRIDWQTSASILEKIIAYEAVHEITSWEDLRRRLDPNDRRCFAFFHPSLIDDPLIFVEVALMREIPPAIAPVLNEAPKAEASSDPTTAVFYSISNCQEGLKGVSFGNFLIKQVVEELAREVPSLRTFVTLSPVPGFARWLERESVDRADELSEEDRKALQLLGEPDWFKQASENAGLRDFVLGMAAEYFLRARGADNKPVDPVARFHLGNGARLESINWFGDSSEKSLRDAHGLMVNYRYDIKDIEKNHEAYAHDEPVASSRAVKALLRPAPKGKVSARASINADAMKALVAPPGSGETGSDQEPAPAKAK